MKNVVILGSTGSLGQQTLKILEKYKKYFRVIGLSANTQKELLKKQAQKFGIKNAVLASTDGEKEIKKLSTLQKTDIIINVLSGVAGINPTLAALKAGKTLILGNKESMFVEGKKIAKQFSLFPRPAAGGPCLIPLDSEHNAISEIIRKIYTDAIKKNLPLPIIKQIILPCSGGPFLNKTHNDLKNVTIQQALNHPKWHMGSKISIESATLINKGLEIIEAHYLFGLPISKIKTIIDPKCLIHGLVQFASGNPREAIKTLAYFSKPNMKEHIENALIRAAGLDILDDKINQKIKILNPAISILKNLKIPTTLPGIQTVLNIFKKNPTTNILRKFLIKEEQIINQFLAGKIKFLEIFKRLKG